MRVRDPSRGLAPIPRRALVLAACLSPALVRADARESSTHAMQWVEGDNIHLAGGRGAINRHGHVEVEVEVFSTGRVNVTDAGKRSENNLYENYSTEESTTWTNLWSGTWSLAGDTMRLDLALDKRRCERRKTWSDAAPESKPCDAVSKQVRLVCHAGTITLGDPATPPGRAAVPVWTCAPEAPADLADTPSRWVLGKASCVKVIGGRGGPGYERCTKAR